MTGDGADDEGQADDPATVTFVDDAAALADGDETPPVREREVVWENPYFAAGYDVVEQPNGGTNTFYWIDPADVVAVVAETDGRVVLVDQLDGRLQGSLLTVPGGGVEDGESFTEAGRRELREETGFRAGSVELLTSYYPTAWARMEQAVVYATALESGPADRDPAEFLDVYAAPVEVALEAVRARNPSFGPGLASLLLAREAGRI